MQKCSSGASSEQFLQERDRLPLACDQLNPGPEPTQIGCRIAKGMASRSGFRPAVLVAAHITDLQSKKLSIANPGQPQLHPRCIRTPQIAVGVPPVPPLASLHIAPDSTANQC
jgi:hypothetical protein